MKQFSLPKQTYLKVIFIILLAGFVLLLNPLKIFEEKTFKAYFEEKNSSFNLLKIVNMSPPYFLSSDKKDANIFIYTLLYSSSLNDEEIVNKILDDLPVFINTKKEIEIPFKITLLKEEVRLPLLKILIFSSLKEKDLEEFFSQIEKSFKKKNLKIVAVGDMMFSRYVYKNIKEKVNGDYLDAFLSFLDLFKSADLRIGNLEGGLSSSFKPKTSGMAFIGEEKVSKALKTVGFDCLSLANNHILDYGKEGLQGTISILEREGINYVGASFLNEEGESKNLKSITLNKNGMRIGIIAFNSIIPDSYGFEYRDCGTYFVHLPPWYQQNEKEIEDLLFEIKKIRNTVDLLIVFPHWGVEYKNEPLDFQKSLAYKMIDSGADLILASHPHVVQTIELYKGKLIIYSMGNFIFDQMWSEDTSKGFVFEVDMTENLPVSLTLHPFKIVDYYKPVKTFDPLIEKELKTLFPQGIKE